MSQASVADIAEYLNSEDEDLLRVFHRLGAAHRLSHGRGVTFLLPPPAARKALVKDYESGKEPCALKEKLLSLIIPMSVSPSRLKDLKSYINAARKEVKITGTGDGVKLEGGVTLKPAKTGLFRCDKGEPGEVVDFVYSASDMPPMGAQSEQSMKDLLSSMDEKKIEGGSDVQEERVQIFNGVLSAYARAKAGEDGSADIPYGAVARIFAAEVIVQKGEATTGKGAAAAVLFAEVGNRRGDADEMLALGSLYVLIMPGMVDTEVAPIPTKTAGLAIANNDPNVAPEIKHIIDNLGTYKANFIFGDGGTTPGNIPRAQELFSGFKSKRDGLKKQIQGLDSVEEKIKAISAAYEQFTSKGQIGNAKVVSDEGARQLKTLQSHFVLWAHCIKHDMRELVKDCKLPSQDDWKAYSSGIAETNSKIPISQIINLYKCYNEETMKSNIWLRQESMPNFDMDPLSSYLDMLTSAVDSFLADSFLEFGFEEPADIPVAGGAEGPGAPMVEALRVWTVMGGDLDGLVRSIRGGYSMADEVDE